MLPLVFCRLIRLTLLVILACLARLKLFGRGGSAFVTVQPQHCAPHRTIRIVQSICAAFMRSLHEIFRAGVPAAGAPEQESPSYRAC